jgi:uncharacterized membrane protein YeaQ/YmgE (transglycosylase-associated protein family)
MQLNALLGLLLTVAICALIAFVAALVLRSRPSILGCIGAGLFGQALGLWIAGTVHGVGWPYTLAIIGPGVHLLWTFVGALLVLLVFRYVPRSSS